MFGDQDTIAAIATPVGYGALGIVRLSGSKSFEIATNCFKSQQFDPRKNLSASFGYWMDANTKESLDQVVVLTYLSGHGFTGEEAVEIIGHGGPRVLEAILNSCVQAGARPARAGEFSYRAFMNGKMSLAQAEAVHEMIHSRSARGARQALLNIQGKSTVTIQEIEQEILTTLAHLEANIDFVLEDIEAFDYSIISNRINMIKNKCQHLLDSHLSSQNIHFGKRVVICGAPNVGKSSLLNALVGKDRSIVADEEGTTRDVVEAEAIFAGELVKMVDTAGLRDTSSSVERLGVSKAKQEIEGADLVIKVVSAEKEGVGLSEIADHELIVVNKSDLFPEPALKIKQTEFPDFIFTSTITGLGLDILRKKIESKVTASKTNENAGILINSRQAQHVKTCVEFLNKCLAGIDQNISNEFVAFDLRAALVQIRSILGLGIGEDIINQVFAEFCIGK